jgi:DNA-binding NarL/FixJ family response regulator
MEDGVDVATDAGADGVVGRDATGDEIVATIESACRGCVRLTIDLVREVVARAAEPAPVELTPEDRSWLRELAAGATIVDLALQAGYSERAMYRLLRGLYDRMGVGDRTGALLAASRWGLLSPGAPTDGLIGSRP